MFLSNYECIILYHYLRWHLIEEDSKERNKEESKTRVTEKETLDDEDYNEIQH